jgi:hypothetical protein
MEPSTIVAECLALVLRGTKPTLVEVRPLVAALYALPGGGAGGSLHSVLDDGNWRRDSVEYCIRYAEERGDAVCAALGRVLLLLSNSQRRKLI